MQKGLNGPVTGRAKGFYGKNPSAVPEFKPCEKTRRSPVIYLAGKIGHNDWRHSVVPDCEFSNDPEQVWPIFFEAISGKYSYAGPYFIACDHGCSHGDATHGYAEGCGEGGAFDTNHGEIPLEYARRKHVVEQCQAAIQKSDYVFAWIDDLTAFGTLFELGYAISADKDIFLGIKSNSNLEELWFIETAIREYPYGSVFYCSTVEKAFAAFLCMVDEDVRRQKIESPIELNFYQEMVSLGCKLEPQWEIAIEDKIYRADFALPDKKISFELDGHEYHKTKEQRTNDARRERDFQKAGWKVIRFTGTEIFQNARRCALDAMELIQGASA